MGKRPPLPPPPAFLLPSTSAPRPRPCFPDPLFSRLGAAGWGLPGEEVPLRHSEGEGLAPRPPPPALPLASCVLLAHGPFPCSPELPLRPGLPRLPLPGLLHPWARLPSRSAATSEVARERVGDADVTGRRNQVASPARRVPGDPPRSKGFPGAAAGRRDSPSAEAAGSRPGGAQPRPPERGGPCVCALGRRAAGEGPLPPQPPSRAPPASPFRRARPGALPRLCLLE